MFVSQTDNTETQQRQTVPFRFRFNREIRQGFPPALRRGGAVCLR